MAVDSIARALALNAINQAGAGGSGGGAAPVTTVTATVAPLSMTSFEYTIELIEPQTADYNARSVLYNTIYSKLQSSLLKNGTASLLVQAAGITGVLPAYTYPIVILPPAATNGGINASTVAESRITAYFSSYGILYDHTEQFVFYHEDYGTNNHIIIEQDSEGLWHARIKVTVSLT